MDILDKYLPKIEEYLGTTDLEKLPRPFGYTVIRRDRLQLPPGTDQITIDGLTLDLKDSVFLDFALILESSTGIRSHEEEAQEIVKNIGENPLQYLSVDENGFYHGFAVSKEGLLYVAKVVFKDYSEGSFFRIPYNTYSSDMQALNRRTIMPGNAMYSINLQ